MSSPHTPDQVQPVVGILGAGRAGTAFARALLAAGVGVDICSTRPPKALRHHLTIYAPGAEPVTPEEIAVRTRKNGPGIVILAVPQEELDEIEQEWIGESILIDATNTWTYGGEREPLPGWLEAAVIEQLPSSMAIAGRFSPARTVKALNHIAHSEIDDAARPDHPIRQRRALAVAADDDRARGLVMGLLVRMGFDPVSVGPLAAGKVIEPDGPLFNRPLHREDILPYAR